MKIQILMSTYNGEKYLRSQLNSIIAQTVQDMTLLIRDDGSTDGTIKIVQEYQRQYSWISYYQGENIGVQRSFLELIQNSDPKADYVALSDQDDEWLPKKLERAIWCLSNMNTAPETPLLYCSDKQIVDANLKALHVTMKFPVKKASFGNALVQNICTGCTAVMNQSLATLIKKYYPIHSNNMIMHDWWLYLTASCFGQVYYDNHSYIMYRQHKNNVYGAITNHHALLRHRINEIRKPRGAICRQAKLFENVYWNILNQDKLSHKHIQLQKVISAQKGLANRLRMVCDPSLFRQKRMDNLILKAITLIGKL